MKHWLLLANLCLFLNAGAQTKKDTVALLQNTVKLFDLNFTEAEADSMIGNVNNYYQQYKALHQNPVPNHLPFTFGFHPQLAIGVVPDKTSNFQFAINRKAKLPANKNELAFYSIADLAGLLKTKQISSVALTTFFLDRLKKYGDTLKCVITLTEDTALAQAKIADDEIKKGINRGPLHGIPYGLKDLFAVKGYKTTWGSTPYKDQYVDEDAFVYNKLKDAGAVLCAKLSMGALAQNNKWFGGDTKNPWDLTQGSSGSSAGSASAVVAGLLPFTIGTETLGSIISPSTRCGATGLRPTFGAVGRSGAMVLCWSLDKTGPICRSAEDAAVVFNYIYGKDNADASSVAMPYIYNNNTDIKKLKIAYAENYFKRLPATSHEQKLLEVYRSMGANLIPVTLPDSAMYPNGFINIILGAECAAAFDELTRSNMDDLVERQDKNFWPNTFRGARMIPAVEYINANRQRYTLCKKFNEFMQPFDALLVPTFSGRHLAITNLTGHPAIAMPIGYNQEKYPVSITIIGNLYDDGKILSVAKAFQDKTDINKQHPLLFSN